MSIRQDLKRKLALRKQYDVPNHNYEDEYISSHENNDNQIEVDSHENNDTQFYSHEDNDNQFDSHENNDNQFDTALESKRPRVESPHDRLFYEDEDSNSLNDDDSKDSNYEDEGSTSGGEQERIQKKDSRRLLRRKNIRMAGDSQCEVILRSMGLYKHLRRSIGKSKQYSVKEANQIVKKVSCYIAFVTNTHYGGRINLKNTVKVLRRTLKPCGHQLVYDYVEMLAEQGTMPSTLSHQIDYIKAAERWAQNCIRKCRKHPFTPFKEYAADLVKQVLIYVSYTVSLVLDIFILSCHSTGVPIDK